MRVLITGATGFLGQHLCRLAAEAGHELRALVRSGEGDPSALGLPAGVALSRGDVLDAESVRQAAEGCEAVLHCAGRVSRRPEDASLLYEVHVVGTKTVLDAARAAGVRRAVVASTSGTVAVSETPEPIKNEESEAPLGLLSAFPYYMSKLFAEQAALERSSEGFEVVVVNPTLLLGPGDVTGSSTGDVVEFLEERVPFVPQGGLSFVDARDAAAAMLAALGRGRGGERYLLAAQNLTVAAFFDKLERLSGVRGPRLSAPKSKALAALGVDLLERLAERAKAVPAVDRKSAEMAQLYWYVDAGKARRELGFAPRDPTETLSDTIEDLRARGVVWPRP